MKVRELRVTDIRCGGCQAAPGEECRQRGRLYESGSHFVHAFRAQEFEALVDHGWEWQEVDPTDKGSRRPL